MDNPYLNGGTSDNIVETNKTIYGNEGKIIRKEEEYERIRIKICRVAEIRDFRSFVFK